VIIPNYNYGRYLDDAIRSVQAQTYKNIEVIVVNNGSTDNSMEVLRKYGSSVVVIDQNNMGQAGARNSGLSAAKGSLIAFLDADDYWKEDKLEKQSRLIDSKNELVYSGLTRFRDQSLMIDSSVIPSYSGDCQDYFISLPAASVVLSGESTSIFTRSLLEKVGGFDPELNSAAGWDFFRRCSKFTDFDFVPEPLINYRLHSSNMSNSSQNTIVDIRRAYKKLFADDYWNLSSRKIRRTIISLEYSFTKTYFKKRSYKIALGTFIKAFFLRNY
jgi:glycosyltransferase involved in cell wall biosynthesis